MCHGKSFSRFAPAPIPLEIFIVKQEYEQQHEQEPALTSSDDETISTVGTGASWGSTPNSAPPSPLQESHRRRGRHCHQYSPSAQKRLVKRSSSADFPDTPFAMATGEIAVPCSRCDRESRWDNGCDRMRWVNPVDYRAPSPPRQPTRRCPNESGGNTR